jgi:predicted regulator of Ras-like GTPase activity (Roadblock/LC7/MglB family)
MTQYKLGGISKSELKPGFMKEVTVEGVEEGKLLLVQVGDKVNAISPKCT